ncbi:MAG: hypothetical protein HYV68_01715 [Candidatus Taylorbacteria bacterium]|nr:hypothetical protein [Candidatus Taylorbacteria bacterium]
MGLILQCRGSCAAGCTKEFMIRGRAVSDYKSQLAAWRRPFLKRLDHPDYDFITVPRKFDYSLEENKWVGFKAVSFLEKAKNRTRNFVYISRDPFLGGNRKPGFELYSQWIDQDGLSTGKYSQAALWGGCRTTLRLDGWKSMDFYAMSVYRLEDRF